MAPTDGKLRAVFWDVHSGLTREGPGTRESTERALALGSECGPTRGLGPSIGPLRGVVGGFPPRRECSTYAAPSTPAFLSSATSAAAKPQSPRTASLSTPRPRPGG